MRKIYQSFFKESSPLKRRGISLSEAAGIRPGFVYETDTGKYAFKDKDGGYHYFKTEDEAKEERDAMGLGKKDSEKSNTADTQEKPKDEKPAPKEDKPEPKDEKPAAKEEPKSEPQSKKEPEKKSEPETTISETPEEKQQREEKNKKFLGNFDRDMVDPSDPMWKKLDDKGVDVEHEYEHWKKQHGMFSDAHVGSGELKDFLWKIEHDYKGKHARTTPRRPRKEGDPLDQEELDYNRQFEKDKENRLDSSDQAAVEDLEKKNVSIMDEFNDWSKQWDKKYRGQWQHYNKAERAQQFMKSMRKKYDLPMRLSKDK